MSTTTLLLLLCIIFICQIYIGYAKEASHSTAGCIDTERLALIDFKRSLIDPANRLSSWTGEDCCNWNGITCNNLTGHVEKLHLRNPIQAYIHDDYFSNYYDFPYFNKHRLEGEINPSICNLQHLHYLDLSFNNFLGTPIPTFFGSIKNLRYLNLTGAEFSGEIPPHLGNLSNLEYLYLGSSPNSLTAKSLTWVAGFASLKALDLSGNNLSESLDWLDSINMLPSLSSLNLRSCDLLSKVSPPLSHFNLTSLVSLDIGENFLNSTSLLELSNLTSKLEVLRLNRNLFECQFPFMLEKFTSLTLLDLSQNFCFNSSSILDSLCNITSLVSIDLSVNQFEGSLPLCLGNLTSLVDVYLVYNNFGGKIPNELGHLKQLTRLDLSHNSFKSQSLPLCFGNITSLIVLNLASNKFGGKMPCELGHLKQLSYLDLSYNSFNIQSLILCLGNLTSLRVLNLAGNKFGGKMPSELGNLKQLTRLDLSYNSFSSFIPSNFGNLTNLQELLINNNQMTGAVPSSLGQLIKLLILDISYNSLTGELSESHFMKLHYLEVLSISNNQFLTVNVSSQWIPPFQLSFIKMDSVHIGSEFPSWLQTQRNVFALSMRNASISGAIPKWFGIVFSNVNSLDLSSNKINGSLSGNGPHSLCSLSSIVVLTLANNQLTGRIPPCFGNLRKIAVLNLANNSLSGHIPGTLGNLDQLCFLHLNRNKFYGVLPSSLKNLNFLTTLDLSENLLEGTIPDWIGKELSYLVFLILKENKFFGNIPSSLCKLSSLQILNLADNNLIGKIPRCLGNLSGMLSIHPVHFYPIIFNIYRDVLLNNMKGIQREYPSSLLQYVKSISLSGNHLHGEIPNELLGLDGLQSLNLSSNHLSGNIPEKIGNLKQLESLDLSKNQLVGSIPQSLVDIDALSYLNLSFNNLVGHIPSGNHFDTLNDPSIYEGNSGLCGKPIAKSCPDDLPLKENGPVSIQRFQDDNGLELPWFYAGIGPGFAVGLLIVLCILLFKKSWRHAYFEFVENVYNKV